MFRTHYVERNAAHVALVYRAYDLCHYRIANLVGKCSKLAFRVAHHFGHHRDACALEYLMHQFGGDVSVFLDACDNLSYPRDVNAEEFYLG